MLWLPTRRLLRPARWHRLRAAELLQWLPAELLLGLTHSVLLWLAAQLLRGLLLRLAAQLLLWLLLRGLLLRWLLSCCC
ncbi:hypothetical protein, partial [Halobacterium bonnevillei]|uniref:hypothetical protein n=1 Tax=Halobacterium bonnevillei TaxID=2692200 RepID=UPI001F1DCB9E